MSKAKLKSSSKIVENNTKPSIQNSNPAITYETVGWGPIISGWVKSILLFILAGIGLALALYIGLSATVAYGVKIDNKMYGVARDTFIGDVITPQAIVYGSATEPVKTDILSKIIQGTHIIIGQPAVPDPVVVQVIAGPTFKFNNTTQGIEILTGKQKGTIIEEPINGINTQKNIIENAYIVECKWGECEKGELFLLPANQISGEIISLDNIGRE